MRTSFGRVSLDLAAELPGPADVTRFGLTSSQDKRGQVIDKLANSSQASARWARYWTNAIYTRSTNARAAASRITFEAWMTERLRSGAKWDEIVTDMITATGDVRDNGATGLIFAHDGDAAEVASEVSRLFTGIQMSCANCHDHPSDQWKRTEFHELAAYFPRVRVRQDRSQTPPRFSVTSEDFARGNPQERFQSLMRLDRNRDGKVTEREVAYVPRLKESFPRILDRVDANGDGALSKKEIEGVQLPPQRNNDIEHFMADLDNPTSKGERMQPVFFATNDRLPAGASDKQRRSSLARSLTSPKNEWFAKAIVNRYWHELLGEGFYMPVDDLGPGREPMMPEVLRLLAGGFQRNNYDLQWLVQTIARTEAYQRSMAEPDLLDVTAGSTSLAATRLDADQIYGALRAALNVSQLGNRSTTQRGPRMVPTAERFAFNQVFGEDPSIPKADIVGSIPQALAMMNSAFIERGIAGSGRTRLAGLLRDYKGNEDVTIELYLGVLGREPSDDELATTIEYVADSNSRTQGFEDVYWALINSAEFLSRR